MGKDELRKYLMGLTPADKEALELFLALPENEKRKAIEAIKELQEEHRDVRSLVS